MTERDAPGSPILPEATSNRWKPLRGGFLNIYRYDRQEFRYEDGRLLLRGNNGTGKSRVLALQLPFLLDGEINPTRVEPDQDPAKRMDWNLLMGGKHDDRLGYTWLEFGRVDETGLSHYQVIGCGMRAVQGRGIVQQWFFLTSQRLGRDLLLENEHGQPLTKAKLEEVIGEHGRVFGSGHVEDDRRDYRRAVDAALFGLGDRYEALLNLLIQLRQPQLSRKLNEQVLSDALSLALPPLPASVLEDVADAFRSLETDRQELADFTAASESSATFLGEYRRYIQIAARRRAEEVRKAHSAYENTMRKRRDAEEEVKTTNAELQRLKETRERLEAQEQSAVAAEQTLKDSPEMKSARELQSAGELAEAAEDDAKAAESHFNQAQSTFLKAEGRMKETAGDAENAWKLVLEQKSQSLKNAEACDLGDDFQRALERLDIPTVEPAQVSQLFKTLQEATKQRLEGIKHLEKLNVALENGRHQLRGAQEAVVLAESDLQQCVEGERREMVRLETETVKLFSLCQMWKVTLVELEEWDFEELESSFRDWLEVPESESPLAVFLKQADRRVSEKLSMLTLRVETRRDEGLSQRQQVHEERERLYHGQQQPPPLPYTRDATTREDRAGAPLWALFDFHPFVPVEERAKIEAALESAGLLDAWVTPDGRALASDGNDTVLVAGHSALASVGERLDRVLKPDLSSNAGVTESTLNFLLQHIGYGADSGEHWVDAYGQWQLGPLRGSWSKPAAEYIGHASREAARLRRIEDLGKEIENLDSQLADLEDELRSLRQREAVLRKEITDAPRDNVVRQIINEIETAKKMVSASRSRLTTAEERRTERHHALMDATQERDRDASDLKLSAWVDRLGDLRDYLHDYSQSLAVLLSLIQSHDSARRQSHAARNQYEEASRFREDCRERYLAQNNRAAAARSHFSTLESTTGKTVSEVMQQLEDATRWLKNIREQKEKGGEDTSKKNAALAVATNNFDRETSELEIKETTRKGHVAGLVSFAGTGQLKVAHEQLEAAEAGSWSVTRVVELAREIESLLSQVDHGEAAWKRNQQEIHHHFEALQTSLRSHGYLPEASISDEIFVVSIPFQGRVCTVAELRDGLVTVIQERRQLLDAKEREVLENYLIDEVANHLHDLLHRALRWRDEANAELESRPMATGMTLRFTWEPAPNAPPAFAEARRLLLGSRGTWSPAQRKAVGEFLQQQIQVVRTANDTGVWQDHLAMAFDYRKWHQFSVERRQDGQWKRLTKRTHGTGSGGEKAIALTLPQLAAAAAHYRSASPLAPRLILLDEAFVGVDKNMRAKCLDLLCAFDLDVVMTSESEWACYPTVPAIAIYQLAARDGIDAVYVSRWVWNGKQRVQDHTVDIH